MPINRRSSRVLMPLWKGTGVFLAALFWMTQSQAAKDGDDTWIVAAYHRSFSNENVQKYDEAIRALEPVRVAYPEGYTVNLRLGWLNYLAGHHANAILHYRKAVAVAPGNIEARLGLLLPLLAQQRHAEAEEVAQQILRTDPYNYYGNVRLVAALQGQGKYEAARGVVQRMLVLYPADVTFLRQLASIEQALGRQKVASRLFRSVYILDPDDPAAGAFLRNTGDDQ